VSAEKQASAIYRGRVSHRRLVPKRHEFDYPVFMFYLDLAEVDGLFAGSRLWSATRAAPVRFRRSDFLGDPAVPLADAVRRLVAEHSATPAEGPVRLLTNVRGFGYIFNPISVYYCFDESGERLTHVVADVTNTPWRQSKAYVFDAPPDGGSLRGSVRKQMHVSPFLDMDFEYEIFATEPGDELHLSIANRREGQTHFVADLRLRRRPATNAQLRRAVTRHPAMSASAVAHIYLQALIMRVKGFRWHANPSKEKAVA
jgi:DUF1365 family protein